jgi:two-component system sensor histidine kinase MprB
MALRLDQSLPALEDRALVRVRRRAPGLTFDATLAPWWVVGEAAAMERAITNLLDNAAKWSPPEGRVTVRVSAGVLTVDDQGPGIDAEDLPHVFERFYRARESRGMPGSGLGLSIVRQVVARHAGTVAVHNREGGGTRFTVVLPGSSSPHGASSERRGTSGS